MKTRRKTGTLGMAGELGVWLSLASQNWVLGAIALVSIHRCFTRIKDTFVS
ncbi:MAG: hypothetical protein JGK30_20770 [Microcoleus sp. PH2017_40_RAT_O_B]|uniref:hypothetical protein n=1 Tax=unclassified Microcoleus TaxID=2642155 RepID=UPI001D21F9DD|nr:MULTISPECIES: hypothetical protein [unclassified Microcoleus]MCC3574321.1 hypothetical protein [Microcoleus sp. PH2017_34_RAT_O_A]MCC3611841.1 hypothetical protein [Microcoleus sp. PH2017_40_RAT_O_B]